MEPSTQVSNYDDPIVATQAKNLTKAIFQHESGMNYNATGDAGTSTGAGQWQPATWKAQAQDVLGDANAPMTPANQSVVAQGTIRKLIKQGKNAAQIAAIWNSGGDQGWENKVGKTVINGQQISYNVPKYVKDVTDLYQQYKGQQTQGQFVNPSAPQQTSGNTFVQPPVQTQMAPTETSPKPEEKQGLLGSIASGVGGFLRSAEAPFLGVAAIPTQLLAKGLGQEDPFKKGIGGGATPGDVTPLNLGQKAGDIAQVGSYFVPGSGVLGAAGMGALQGAGSAMSNKADLGTVVGQGALGAGLGSGTALAAKGIGYGLNKVGEALSGEGVQNAVQGIKDAYSKALNLNASERGFESRSGKDLAQVLLDNSISLGRNANGTLDASSAIEKLQLALNPLNQKADSLVGDAIVNGQVSHYVPLDATKGALIDTIKSSTMDSLEKENSIRQATKLMAAIKREYGDVVSPQVSEKIKQTLQGTAFKKALTTSDSLQKNVSYLASRIMKDSTEKAIGGNAGKEYALLNSQRSDLVDAITRLSKLDGTRIVKGGRLGNMAGGLTGAIIGSQSGGLLGGLTGDYFGTKAAEFLNNPATQINLQRAKAQALGKVPGLLGKASLPIGKGLSKTGQTTSKLARPAGLMANLLAK